MTAELDAFRTHYQRAFSAYLAGGDEAELRVAYELGRTAITRDLGVLDLADIHHEVMLESLEASEGAPREVTRAGSAFLVEVLSTYEMVQRGFAEAQHTALENAELYNQERVVAETLQRRLLPTVLPAVPGLTMAWRYLPGWEGSDIGGDWYDAIELPEGRVAFVVGDVVGKGIGAAAGMGQVRIALRAYAIEDHPPAAVIARLDQVLDGLEEEFATAVYLVYDPSVGSVRYANAGHPPPLLLTPDGGCLLLSDALNPPLGSMFGTDCQDDQVPFEDGSTLVLYTDGLVERRRADIDRGIERLRTVAAEGDPSDLEAFCDHVLAGMDIERRGDDIALLAVRVGDASPPPPA